VFDKLGIYRTHGGICLKVSLKPFQRLVGAVANGGRPSQRAKYPLSFKAPRKGEFRRSRKRENTQVGVFPFDTKAYFKPLSAFLLMQ